MDVWTDKGMTRAARRWWPIAGGLVGLAVLSACSLPQADGVEAEIAARGAELTPLSQNGGDDAHSAARNGLLLHPGVREAASRVMASADEVRVQRAALFPALGLSFGGGVGDAGRGDPGLELTGRQLVMDFGNTRRKISAADIDLQINYIAFQKGVDAALIEMLEAHDSVRMQGELLDLRRRQLTAMRDLEKLVSERIEAGATTAPDLLETRKRVQSAEFLVHDAELSLAESRDRLARLTGQSKGGVLPEMRSSCMSPGIADDIRMAHLALAKAVLDLEYAENARQPRIVLSPVARQESGSGVGLGLNLGVDSDLLQGGALTARVNAARNALEGARAGVEAAEREVKLRDQKLLRDIAATERRREMLDRQIDLLTQTRVLYRSQYLDLGTRQLPELLDNEEEIFNRQAERIEARSALARYRLDCAAGDRSLRTAIGIGEFSLYGYPLSPDDI